MKSAYPCDLWQHTERERLTGVAGYVNLNKLNSSKPLEYFIGEEPTAQSAKAVSKPKPAAGPCTVKKGDTLSVIAAKYNTSVSTL